MAKLFDGIDVLVIFPTDTGKTIILTMFILVLDQIIVNLGHFPSHCRQFLDKPIIVVYLTNYLKEK